MTLNINSIKPNKEKALYLAKREVSELVYDAIQLENINFTLPEVQTLLDGVTVGGHKVLDQQVVINQGNAWQFIFDLVKDNKFTLNKETACAIHKIAGYQDALKWGEFRDNNVRIAGTDYLPPKYEELDNLFENMIQKANKIENIYDKSIYVFLEMACNQFFYDINKRTGRFMMNGILLQEGYPILNVKAKDKQQFNELMLDFYTSSNQQPMNAFLKQSLTQYHISFMQIDSIKNKSKSKDLER